MCQKVIYWHRIFYIFKNLKITIFCKNIYILSVSTVASDDQGGRHEAPSPPHQGLLGSSIHICILPLTSWPDTRDICCELAFRGRLEGVQQTPTVLH